MKTTPITWNCRPAGFRAAFRSIIGVGMLHAVSTLAADPAAADFVRGEFHELNAYGAGS